LLANSRDDYKNIAINKLKDNNAWKAEQGWFVITFEKYGIETWLHRK